jgi:hypothetical protein
LLQRRVWVTRLCRGLRIGGVAATPHGRETEQGQGRQR